MGYYTTFSIDIKDSGNESIDCESAEELITEHLEFNPFEESLKWYGHEDDMKAFSKKHPSVVFRLEGEGEESGDIWVKYFKNGEMQKCKAKIVIDDYDENKLA